MSTVRVKVLRQYFDGERRVRENDILDIDEKQFSESCHEHVDGKPKKIATTKKQQVQIPGAGPMKPKPKITPEAAPENQMKNAVDEETPI